MTLAHNAIAEARYLAQQSRAPRLRTMLEFAEEEIVLPDGPDQGLRFRCDRQPYSRLWFRAVDSGEFNEFIASGPVQSGKSLTCFVIPLLYHNFEMRETAVCGLPDMDMASDKWRRDLLPVILRTRYNDLLPNQGSGSRGGGKTDLIEFGNGAALKFMSGGGRDKSRAAFTTRVLAITETDGLDTVGMGSDEADKIKQLEARTSAFDTRKRIYKECTVSMAHKHTWARIWNSTRSRIVLWCPYPECGAGVTPERQHLAGWENATTVAEARRNSRWHCPACGGEWSEADRLRAHDDEILVHGGVRDVSISELYEFIGSREWSVVFENRSDLDNRLKSGVAIRTESGVWLSGYDPEADVRVCGFRYAAINNMLVSAGTIGEKLWEAAQATDPENAERELCQYYFCLPYVPDIQDAESLVIDVIAERYSGVARGYVPADAEAVTVGVDVGKAILHWVVIAWRSLDGFYQGLGEKLHGQYQVVAYGHWPTPHTLSTEARILAALHDLAEELEKGFPLTQATTYAPTLDTFTGENGVVCVRHNVGLVDARWRPDPVMRFCSEHHKLHGGTPRWRPSEGFGATAEIGNDSHYTHPRKPGGTVRWVGEQCHVFENAANKINVVKIDADHWKTRVHSMFNTPLDQPGSLAIFNGERREHTAYARAITAEKAVQEFILEKGTITKWVRVRQDNHWLDATELACVGGHLCPWIDLTGRAGRVQQVNVTPAAPRAEKQTSRGRGDKPFLASAR